MVIGVQLTMKALREDIQLCLAKERKEFEP